MPGSPSSPKRSQSTRTDRSSDLTRFDNLSSASQMVSKGAKFSSLAMSNASRNQSTGGSGSSVKSPVSTGFTNIDSSGQPLKTSASIQNPVALLNDTVRSPTSAIKSPAKSDTSLITTINATNKANNVASIHPPSSSNILDSSPKPSQFPGAPGPVEVRSNLGLKVEVTFSLAGAGIFLALWIYLMSTVCYRNDDNLFFVKVFCLIGVIVGLFITIYCIFERSITQRRGLVSCIFITSLVAVGMLNLVGAYMSLKCFCKCEKNAVKDGGPDMIAFIMEIVGSSCLFGVLIVAALTR